MGLSVGHRQSSSAFRPQKLPIDASTLAIKGEPCHCVADAELDNRYNTLRAEEHARKEGKCGPEWSTEVAELPENVSRNRYPTVVPWDHSRVVLPVEEGANDYINASWVQLGSRTYIATQGPLGTTIGDFWQMVYAYGGEPAVIIMLTPLYEHAMEKCAKYWPDNKSNPIIIPKERGFNFGLTVQLKSFHKNDHYHFSTFSLTSTDKNMPERTVHHIYYYSWLDYSKPNADADLRSLIHLVNNKLRNRASPPIVHCSAGIGRTGTFIALDALLTRIDTDILPVMLPAVVPIWKGEQQAIQYRKSLFTGPEDTFVESESNSPLLSKFDVNQASSVAPSFSSSKSIGNGSVPLAEPQSTAATTVNTTKQTPPAKPSNQVSLLSTALSNSMKVNTSSLSSSEAMSKDAQGASSGDAPQQAANLKEETDAGTNGSTAVSEEPAQEEPIPKLSPEKKSSALSGPAIRKVAAKITSVAPEVFSETPETVDVLKWFDPSDPVMSVIRTMRKQRPKMVQGKQQLGYIYDQFEVGQQLARVTHGGNGRRRSTQSCIDSQTPPRPSNQPKSKPMRVLSKLHIRSDHSQQSSTTITTKTDQNSPTSSITSKKSRFFSGTVLR